MDVSKAIDKVNGEAGRLHKFTAWMRTTGLTGKQINDATGTFMGSHYLTDKSQPAIPTPELWAKLRPLCGDVPVWVDELVERIAAEREVVGRSENGIAGGTGKHAGQDAAYGFAGAYDITAPATDAARQWQGWGTALKPALEPITVARKPLVGTVAANVLAHGTGALNIDGCRVETDDNLNGGAYSGGAKDLSNATSYATGVNAGEFVQPVGRWPANLIHDGSEEVLAGFPQARSAGDYCGKETEPRNSANYMPGQTRPGWGYADTGSAARFFYCAKASKRDRNASNASNSHPTVKPTDLMAYLCRLVTPPGGVVLDPFMGSGSTGKAAMREGFRFIGCEMSPEYMTIARARIEEACKQPRLIMDDLFA